MGSDKSSQKKSMQEQRRKSDKKGVKIRLPTKDIKEKGNPHAINRGREARDKKSWTCMKL